MGYLQRVLMLCLAMAAATAMARGAWFQGPALSAKHVEQDGDSTIVSKVYISEAGMRRVAASAPDGEMIYVSNFNQRKTWLLLPGKRVYVDMGSMEDSGQPMAEVDVSTLFHSEPCKGFDLTKQLGPASVGGRQTQQWMCGNSKTRHQVKQWFDPELKLVIKEQNPQHGSVELHDIKVASQPDTLFDLPKGYKKGSMKDLMPAMPPTGG